MRQKRVILAVSNDIANDNRIHKMAMTLVQNEWKVRVVGRKLPQSQTLPLVPYEQKRLRLLFKKGFLFYAELNIRLFFYFLFHHYDCATANDLDTLPALFVATKLRRKILVYDSHELFTEVPELVNRPRVQRFWKQIEQMTFPHLTHCLTVCNSIAEIYKQKYHIPVQVIRNVPYYQSIIATEKIISLPSNLVILYQGALNKGRGLELLIESMQYVKNACLLIVGDGDIAQQLRELTHKLHLESTVIFTGKVPRDKLYNYTQLATIGVSVEEDMCLNYHYALPNKLFDYIQNGKPVLVSNLPEMRAIVEQYSCGEILVSREPKSVAQQMTTMLHNPQKLQNYHHNCNLAAQELCWEKEEHKVIEMYESEKIRVKTKISN